MRPNERTPHTPEVNTGENAIRIMRITQKAYESAQDGVVKTI